jgi:hypothetical protein
MQQVEQSVSDYAERLSKLIVLVDETPGALAGYLAGALKAVAIRELPPSLDDPFKDAIRRILAADIPSQRADAARLGGTVSHARALR